MLKLTLIHEKYLKHFCNFPFLTVSQMITLCDHSQGYYNGVYEGLQKLATEKPHPYLHRMIRSRPDEHGSRAPVYFLSGKGESHLNKLRDHPKIQISYTPKRAASVSPLQLEHTILVNEMLIRLFSLFNKYPEHFTYRDYIHERAMRNFFNLKTDMIYPDGLIYTQIKTPDLKEYDLPLTFEIERMSAHVKEKWQHKVRFYPGFIEYTLQAYLQIPGNVPVRILVITETANDMANLILWTEQELRQSHQQAYAPAYRFCVFDKTLSALDFYCSPRWTALKWHKDIRQFERLQVPVFHGFGDLFK